MIVVGVVVVVVVVVVEEEEEEEEEVVVVVVVVVVLVVIVCSLVTYLKTNLIIYYPPPCSAHVFEALGAAVKTDMQGGQMKICVFVFHFYLQDLGVSRCIWRYSLSNCETWLLCLCQQNKKAFRNAGFLSSTCKCTTSIHAYDMQWSLAAQKRGMFESQPMCANRHPERKTCVYLTWLICERDQMCQKVVRLQNAFTRCCKFIATEPNSWASLQWNQASVALTSDA